MERVVVTGLGLVSPLAPNSRSHFEKLLAGLSAVSAISNPQYQENSTQLQAKINGFDRREFITNRIQRKLLSHSCGFAVGAAGEALNMAGLIGESEILESCGLYVGSLSLEIDPDVFIPPLRASLDKEGLFDISLFAKRGMKLLDPLFLVKALPNAGVCGISVQYQVLGPNTNLTNGTTSSLMAIGLGVSAIQRGEVDCALAGGYDTLLGMDSFVEHFIANRLSQRYDDPAHACRPFDREQDGYVLGEGSAFVFLESETHAKRRGAKILGEIIAVSQTTSASYLQDNNANDDVALRQAAYLALQQGNCSPDELDAIFVDGLATKQDDLREANAVQFLVADSPVPVTTATGAIGFTGAASGAFSLVHALMALDRQIIPPLINCKQPHPRYPIHVALEAMQKPCKRALVWNSDRGIKNIAVLVGVANGE
jgi:3-oxoacyl-[acyl-carrier-protein] synthase II